ncbi:hypothetical protein VMCG_01167 [Cytospora schulzeri]|uniref:Uncharacterized protein n=1 Tax=Cytospora schulzeri TaxID=448051 RepID=A0A423X6D1_9PEZI|nr:hypothetical protein VMCG_01167 [Valsa malicola]
MVPTSALRETIVLIIFGIVLVPIAAKRAQDAPGYWQTFSTKAEQSLTPSWSSKLAIIVNETLTYGLSAAEITKPNETIPLYASRVTRAETRVPMTVRFRIAKVEEEHEVRTTTESSDMAAATVTPNAVSTDDGSTGAPTTIKPSVASKERRTLTWMGAAIAAVALFMVFC